MIEKGRIERKYTATGRHSGYQVRVHHSGLGEVKHLSATDRDVLEDKLDNLVKTWSKKWQRRQAAVHKAKRAEEAQRLTEESQDLIRSLEQVLAHALSVGGLRGHNFLKDINPFSAPEPVGPEDERVPPEPRPEDYRKEIPFRYHLITGQKEKILEEQEAAYQEALLRREEKKREIEISRAERLRRKEKADCRKKKYLSGDEDAVTEYCKTVLNSSAYPDCFPSDFEIQFSSDSGMLIVNYALPGMDDIPGRVSVRYVASRDALEEKLLSAAKSRALYNSACYQIAIRTLYELFGTDEANALKSVTFNGFVTVDDPATGHPRTSCIMSVQSGRDEFMKINLANVDPKACFRALKGVGSANLAAITPVKAILELDKSDRRFQDHYEVAADIDDSTNLAAMNWEDFEHLVRELFEAEFSSAGGEVRVTRASRDGGVDAVAFDPDPIRGGKIVIQAKRYTNTVGMAAVRELYGTVINEGAIKGILITTSDYGADSYEFAKNKPITLLNGSNLLHMLEKHGTKARIDIREAKETLPEQ